MSCAIEVHQNYLLMYCTVLNWLKCPIIECTLSMMIAISCLPFMKASWGIHSTSCFNRFFVKTKPSLQPNNAWAFGFSNILEYSQTPNHSWGAVKVFPTYPKTASFFPHFQRPQLQHYYRASMTGTTCKCGYVSTSAHFGYGTLTSSLPEVFYPFACQVEYRGQEEVSMRA